MKFKDWIHDVANADWRIYIKRLSANDTGATKSHQSGIYFPRSVLSTIFPSINRNDQTNPEVFFTSVIESDNIPEQTLRAIYYNQKTRNEKRITRWKQGIDYTPLQDTEKTGAIAIFAFHQSSGDSAFMRAWVCRNLEEEDHLEERLGELDPQRSYFEYGNILFEGITHSGSLKTEKYPPEWNEHFPAGATIINYLLQKGSHAELAPDERLLKRRDHEFDLFRLVEHHHVLPLIQKGFTNVEDFVRLANSVSNRRKSRSGASLELHLETIFKEEGLTQFETQCTTESNKKPDFLFPGCSCYHDSYYPSDNLRMLAVKTTAKDRWRQILNEAHRITTPYLFTLQQGVSENQFREMQEENVKLVVPKKIHACFPESIRKDLYSLARFIRETKNLYL